METSLAQNQINTTALLVQKIPSLRDQFLEKTLKVFSDYITLDDSGILKYFGSFDIPFQEKDEISFEDAQANVLLFLETLYQAVIPLDDITCISDLVLLKYLLVLHCSNDTKVSTLATKIFGVVIKRQNKLDSELFQLWWKVVEVCILEDGTETVNGYIQWLRCINGNVLKDSLEALEKLFDLELYWDLMIQGLLSKSYDLRKYTLHILSQSLQKIDHNINTSTMFWDISKREKHLWEWERFGTLVNIVSIDTSIHQTGDSAADLVKLIGKDSLIPKTWARCLLSTGLKSSTDSIREFIGNVVLSLDVQDMSIFLDGYEFLTGTLLPHLMLASHFVVKRETVDSEFGCVYGEQLASFIGSIIHYLEPQPKVLNQLLNALFVHLDAERYSFDPARLYLVSGIESGLRGKHVLNSECLQSLFVIFTNFSESRLREGIFHFYFLRLLLSVDQSLVTPEEWFPALLQLVTLQKTLYFEQRESIIKFISQDPNYLKYFTKASEQKEYDFLVLFSDISAQLGVTVDLEAMPPQFFLTVLSWPNGDDLYSNTKYQQKLDLFVNSFLEKIIAEPFSNDFTNGLLLIPVWKQLTNANWLRLEPASKHLDTIVNNISGIQANEDNMTVLSAQLVALNVALLSQTSVSSNTVSLIFTIASKVIRAKIANRNYLDTKKTALTEVHRAVGVALKACSLDFDDNTKAQFLDTLATNFESVDYECRLHIVSGIYTLLRSAHEYSEELTPQFFVAFQTLWSSLAADRLMANEKYLHFSFLDMILDPIVIRMTALNPEFSQTMESILLEVVELSYARRCLLPHISRRFLEYLQTIQKSKTELPLPFWIGTLLARIYIFNQLADNYFRIEIVVASKLDAHPYSGSRQTYLKEYGCNEVDAKIYAAMFFASLDVQNSSHAAFASNVHDYILYNGPYHIFEPLKRNDGIEELERIRGHQVLLLLSGFWVDRQQALTRALLPVVDTEPSPVARIYVEWLLALLNVQDVFVRGVKENVVLREMDKVEESPRVIASLERIALLTARSLKNKNIKLARDYYEEYIYKLVPFSTSNRATVRHSSVSMLVALENEFEGGSQDLVDEHVVRIIRQICSNARASDTFKQHRSGENSVWDIDGDLNLIGACGGVIQKLSDRQIGVVTKREFETCSFGGLQDLELNVPAGFTVSYETWRPEVEESEAEEDFNKISGTKQAEPAPLQTKSGFWNDVINLSLGEDGRDSDKVERGELIVVASLVAKPPNLGGICRLSDVLGAKLLCLGDLGVTKTQAFRGVAVTADRWMPMTEVPESAVLEYMLKMKREHGYTLIGLEQTDKSVELNGELRFPRKSLVLLGKEREGIPGEFLAELDFCVEIKQVGVIRSMNIQTATAVIVHAYSIQHC